MAAWLAVGMEVAVISHEGALDLLGLSDVIPEAVHLTVPRSKRYLPSPPETVVHTSAKSLRSAEMTVRNGIRLTTTSRSILDAAEAGTMPEQIELAVAQALEQGTVTVKQLQEESSQHSARVGQLIATAIRKSGRL